MMDKIAWIKTAFSALLGGAAAGAGAAVQNGTIDPQAVGTAAAVGAASVAIAYLMRSPKK